MAMKLSFDPIARRDLKYVSQTHSMDIVLAISAPYSPPRTPSAAGKTAACMIQDCDDPTLALEVGGDDEFEALQMGLIHLEKFIEVLSADQTGTLVNQDGTPFQAKNASLMAYFLDPSRKKT
jgi:hypothetical protein